MPDSVHLAHRERARRYRKFARAARLSAATARDALRESYVEIAGHWNQLALEADADAAEAEKK